MPVRHDEPRRIEQLDCFREAKEELGLDHYEVRGWRCVHRYFYLTQVSHLFCARVRQEYDQSERESVVAMESEAEEEQTDRLTVEQIRSAMNVWLSSADLPASRSSRALLRGT